MAAFHIQQAQRVLIVSLEEGFHVQELAELERDVLHMVHHKNLNQVIFDLSALQILDAHTFQGLLSVLKALQIMSAEVLTCGMSASIAAYLADMTPIKNHRFKLNLEQALKHFEVQNANS